jgi:hypothetical protein
MDARCIRETTSIMVGVNGVGRSSAPHFRAKLRALRAGECAGCACAPEPCQGVLLPQIRSQVITFVDANVAKPTAADRADGQPSREEPVRNSDAGSSLVLAPTLWCVRVVADRSRMRV